MSEMCVRTSDVKLHVRSPFERDRLILPVRRGPAVPLCRTAWWHSRRCPDRTPRPLSVEASHAEPMTTAIALALSSGANSNLSRSARPRSGRTTSERSADANSIAAQAFSASCITQPARTRRRMPGSSLTTYVLALTASSPPACAPAADRAVRQG